MSFGFGFALPAYPLRGGGGNNPFNQSGPTLDLSFAGVVTDNTDPNGYTLTTNFITPQYQVAAQYTIWEAGVGLVDKTFSQIITFTRASTGTFTGSNGLIQSAAIDAPRFDYDPVTLAAKGLLIEEQRTNLLLYSEAASTSPWNLTNVTATTDTTAAPDGATTADTLTEGVGAQIQFANSQNVTISSGQTITVSRYVKRGTGGLRGFRLECDAGGTNGFRANFNPDTGAVSSSSAFGAGVILSSGSEPAANGFRRYYVTGTVGTSTSVTQLLRFTEAPNSANIGYTGDGIQSFVVWGAQLEAGSFATSYIPTVASQVTRSADVASVNTLSPWYNATEGTFYTEGDRIYGGNTYAPFTVTRNSSTGLTDRIDIGLGTGAGGSPGIYRMDVAVGGVVQASLGDLQTFNANTAYKGAIAYATNNFASSTQGAAVITDSSGSVPSGQNEMLIGSRGTFFLNGHIRRITYYPRRLSNAELQAITA